MDLEATLDAYIEAWNVRDDAARADLLARAVADECEFVGPTGTFRGRPALDSLIVSLQGRMGDAVIVRTGPAVTGTHSEADGRRPRFAWEIRSTEGAVLWSGEDEVESAGDGRLRHIHVVV